MNVGRLNDYLIGNEDDVVRLLESIGFEDIKVRSHELRFARLPGHNPSACWMNLDTLNYKCFSTNEKTNLYGLIMARNKMTFPEALNYVADTLDLDKSKFNKPTHQTFGGFYKKYIHHDNDLVDSVEPIDESLMSPYTGKYNLNFLHDGIGFQTQQKFGIGYDMNENRIAIPEYNESGELCGIMGRSNDLSCPKNERWLPIISCRRSLLLYGYHINYATIQSKSLCIIGESEKFPQQLDSFDCHVGLATCGCNISAEQVQKIKGLFVGRIIVAYDEGLSEDQIRAEAEKLKMSNAIIQNNVGYVFDRGHQILKEGSKDAPSDVGKEGFEWLMKNAVVWL